MATRNSTKSAKARRGALLDIAMAAFPALAVAFVAYAMPDRSFSSLVEMSGLPMLLPAAQPPLGETARLAVIGAGALGAFLFVWLVLRALGGRPAPRKASEPEEISVEVPRLRRADAHPDAPSRRPLFAGRDLGEPLDYSGGVDPLQDSHEADEPEVADEDEGASCPADIEPLAWTEDEEPLDLGEMQPEFESETSSSSQMEPEQASISHLMQRLELALIRREGSGWSGTVEAHAPPARHEAIDDRLRHAIDDLQKIASRGG